MSGTDWLKMWCSTLDNPIVMKDAEHFMLWHVILYLAAAVPQKALFGGKRIDVQPGQLVTDRKQLAAKTGISESKVQRILKTLESEHQIEQQISSKNRLITVLNWHRYQTSEHQIEHQLNINRTSTEHQLNIKGQAGGKPKVNFPIITRNKENKEYIEPTTQQTTSMVVGTTGGGEVSRCVGGEASAVPSVLDAEMAENRYRYGEAIALYEKIKGAPMSPGELDRLMALVDEYGTDWVRDALKITSQTEGCRSRIGYTQGILRNWKQNGRDSVPAVMTQEERLAAIVRAMEEAERNG